MDWFDSFSPLIGDVSGSFNDLSSGLQDVTTSDIANVDASNANSGYVSGDDRITQQYADGSNAINPEKSVPGSGSLLDSLKSAGGSALDALKGVGGFIAGNKELMGLGGSLIKGAMTNLSPTTQATAAKNTAEANYLNDRATQFDRSYQRYSDSVKGMKPVSLAIDPNSALYQRRGLINSTRGA